MIVRGAGMPVVLLGAILAAACGDAGGPTPPPVPTHLAFVVQPAQALDDSLLTPAVQVELRAASGARVIGATNPVTIALGNNPGSAALTGVTTVNAVAGVATFTDLRLDQRGRRYTLIASSGTLAGSTSVPFDIVTPPLFDGVTAGGAHSCGIDRGGYVHCWGRNAEGQLGDGTTTQSPLPVRVPFSAPGASFSRISAGEKHTCALTSTGELYCWGSNEFGQIGDGSQGSDRPTPTLVSGGLTFGWVSAGARHTCGVTAPPDDAVYCWGANDSGQLGDSTQTLRTSPTPVSGGHNFASVSAGGAHTCAVSMGATYCWGSNSAGQLGDSTTALKTSPVPVAGDPGLQEVYAGGEHTCGLTAAAVAYCWGANLHGQLGDSTTTQQTSPVPIGGALRFGTIQPGAEHTCGMSTSVVLHCWGRNGEGQLGDGTTMERIAPQPVAGALYAWDLIVGSAHACAITWDGPTYCWGSNAFGALGGGTATGNNVPVLVVY